MYKLKLCMQLSFSLHLKIYFILHLVSLVRFVELSDKI